MTSKSVRAFFAGAVTVTAAAVAVTAWQASAATPNAGTVFTATTPCRILDTRPAPFRTGPHGTFGAADTKSVTPAGCPIPNGVSALSLNVTAVGATDATFITIWDAGTRPNASSLNPSPGQPPTPNAVVTPVTTGNAFRVFNLAGSVDLIIDVNGYYSTGSLDALEARIIALEGGAAPGPSGFSARVTGYDPGASSTQVVGDVTSGLAVEAEVRVDVTCPNGTVKTDSVFAVPPNATRAWSVLCDGSFTSGVVVTTVRI